MYPISNSVGSGSIEAVGWGANAVGVSSDEWPAITAQAANENDWLAMTTWCRPRLAVGDPTSKAV